MLWCLVTVLEGSRRTQRTDHSSWLALAEKLIEVALFNLTRFGMVHVNYFPLLFIEKLSDKESFAAQHGTEEHDDIPRAYIYLRYLRMHLDLRSVYFCSFCCNLRMAFIDHCYCTVYLYRSAYKVLLYKRQKMRCTRKHGLRYPTFKLLPAGCQVMTNEEKVKYRVISFHFLSNTRIRSSREL